MQHIKLVTVKAELQWSEYALKGDSHKVCLASVADSYMLQSKLEIKHSDWMLHITKLFLTNQSVLFPQSEVMLLLTLFMTPGPGILVTLTFLATRYNQVSPFHFSFSSHKYSPMIFWTNLVTKVSHISTDWSRARELLKEMPHLRFAASLISTVVNVLCKNSCWLDLNPRP